MIVLFTQCLQNDFIRPLAAGERLPNALHIGREEARRIAGDDPEEGPLARFLRAFDEGARASPRHASIHLRDWHVAGDPTQAAHLGHFGGHCLAGTEGARFIAPVERIVGAAGPPGHARARVIDSPRLGDFDGTPLEATLRELAGPDPNALARAKVGIVGVWTDVKVHYLAYDLHARLGIQRIAVASTLVASRSRTKHRAALEHMREVLGVEVIDSIPEFLEWLEIGARPVPPGFARRTFGTEVAARPGDPPLGAEERALVAYLFRDSRRVELARLGGGFSGSRVYRTGSIDREGRVEVPFVVKVDAPAKIARERIGVETVENLLGAASPRVAEFVDGDGLSAIKYGFATMHRSEARPLLSRLRAAGDPDETRRLFEGVFRMLERLHQAPQKERIQLFRHFTFKPEYAATTLARARAVAAGAADEAAVAVLERFYARLADLLAEDPSEDVPVTLVHGDLNLANLLQDDAGNTWMIDYFWTRPGPTVQDVPKLENDLRFVAFAADDGSGRREAALDALEGYAARAIGPADEAGRARARAIAGLRYAAHALSFDECDAPQKRAAIAAAASYASAILSA